MEIHLNFQGRECGPFTVEQIQKMLQDGAITNRCSAWTEGQTTWMPLSSLPPFVPASSIPVLAAPRKVTFWKVVGGTFTVLLMGLAGFMKTEGGRQAMGGVASQEAVPQPVSVIQGILKADALASKSMETKAASIQFKQESDFTEMIGSINAYVIEAKAIDLRSAPKEFAEAYQAHLNAWSEMADALSAHPPFQSGDEALMEGFLRGLAGDPTGGALEKEDEVNSYSKRIHAGDAAIRHTWERVEAAALQFGVQVGK